MSPLLALGAAGAVALLVAAARRPALACVLLALAVPLTAGMARGAALPVLRVNEALLLVVAAGVLAHWLVRRRPLAFTGLDVAVLAFCLVGTVVPWAVILLSHAQADLTEWLVVLGPVQYLVVFLVFSRTELAAGDLRRFLHACMLASIPVAAVAVAQALDLGGARSLASGLYPTAALPSWDTVYRPASLLGHYSALGAFGLLNFLLALALAVTRHPGFSQRWLTIVMGANLLSIVTSQTYAPAAALVLGAAAVVLAARRFPWQQAAAAPPVLVAAGVVFWPSISGRVATQLAGSGGSGLPDSLQTRIDYWQAFFVPALLHHGPWLGTGTLMPAEVPRPLVDFVDNGYLWQLFRAGMPGLLVLLVMLAAVAGAGWAARRSDDPTHRTVGLTCLGAVVGVVLMDATSEYLTFTAVSQEFWMLVGVLAGFAGAWRRPASALPVELGEAAGTPPWLDRAGALAGRLAAPGGLLRSSALLTAGNAAARFLSLLFSIAAARFLAPAGYGVLAYALVVANVGAILIVNAPLALTRSLSRDRDDPVERDAYFTNWMLVMAGSVAVSALVMMPVGLAAGLGGWLLAALLANLLGAAVLQTYQQVQCGLERFPLMVGFWALANLLQLAAALAAGLLGLRSPAVFLAIYGLSSVAALAVLLPLAPVPLRLVRRALRGERVAAIARYVAPLALMNAFTTVWLGADVVLVDRLLSPAAAGRYAAAKVVVNGFAIVSWAVSTAVLPRASRLAGTALRAYLLRALGLTAAAVAPLLLGLAVVARPLVGLVFGDGYLEAGAPLTLLAAAMAVYALSMVLESAWLGLGRPVAAAAASGTGMAVTVLAGLALVPRLGLTGAAVAFAAGSVAQLAVLGALTLLDLREAGEGRPALVPVRARLERLARDWRGLPRRVLWHDRPGYLAQRTCTVPIVPVEEPLAAPRPGPARPAAVGVVADGPSPVGAAAELLGLTPETAAPPGAAHLLDRALVEGWDLVAAPAEALAGGCLDALAAYVGRGGTLYLDGLDERSNAVLSRLGVRLPAVRRGPGGRRLLLPARQAAFAGPLAGTAIETAGGEHVLEPAADPRDVLVWGTSGGARHAVVAQRRAGRGRVVLSTLPRPAAPARPADVLGSDAAGGLVVALLLLRQLAGAAAWHAPLPVANLTIDDPALRQGLLGLRYDVLAAQARDHRFHVTIATVPRELPLADEPVVGRLREHPELLSACYHGCDHAGYEFPPTAAARTRYGARPLAEQRAALERAVEWGRWFTRERGWRLDRVMVFPYGVGPAGLFPDLRRLGFLASCNYWDKYPLEAAVPADADLGLRPADVAWEGFPLLWRRSMADRGGLLDLVLGRPVLHFAHRRELGSDFLPFVERAAAVNRASGGAAAWCGLEDVARHAYLQRCRPGAGWEVLMTADEACLHNPDPEPRTCAVTRPGLPEGLRLQAQGTRGAGPLRVTIPPGGTSIVRVVGGLSERWTRDPQRMACPVFGKAPP